MKCNNPGLAPAHALTVREGDADDRSPGAERCRALLDLALGTPQYRRDPADDDLLQLMLLKGPEYVLQTVEHLCALYQIRFRGQGQVGEGAEHLHAF